MPAFVTKTAQRRHEALQKALRDIAEDSAHEPPAEERASCTLEDRLTSQPGTAYAITSAAVRTPRMLIEGGFPAHPGHGPRLPRQYCLGGLTTTKAERRKIHEDNKRARAAARNCIAMAEQTAAEPELAGAL